MRNHPTRKPENSKPASLEAHIIGTDTINES